LLPFETLFSPKDRFYWEKENLKLDMKIEAIKKKKEAIENKMGFKFKIKKAQ